MDIYHYDEAGEYKGSGVARGDPLEDGAFLIPRNATTVAPPAIGQYQQAVFDGTIWALVEDHRGRDYWAADGTPVDIVTLGPLPAGGTLTAPLAARYTWDGAQWVAPTPAGDDVNAERDRRILTGKTFTLSNAASVELIGAETDMRNLQALAFAASLRIGAGDTTTITNFRDNANVIHQLTPPLMVELFSVGSAYISAIYQASWVLKDGASIPADYAADEHWPT